MRAAAALQITSPAPDIHARRNMFVLELIVEKSRLNSHGVRFLCSSLLYFIGILWNAILTKYSVTPQKHYNEKVFQLGFLAITSYWLLFPNGYKIEVLDFWISGTVEQYVQLELSQSFTIPTLHLGAYFTRGCTASTASTYI